VNLRQIMAAGGVALIINETDVAEVANRLVTRASNVE